MSWNVIRKLEPPIIKVTHGDAFAFVTFTADDLKSDDDELQNMAILRFRNALTTITAQEELGMEFGKEP